MGSWRGGIGPCSSVQAGFNAECAAGCAILLRLPLDSKKSHFFRRPSAKGRRLLPLKNPGEITLDKTSSGARASSKIRGREIKAHITSAYRFKKRQIRGVDDLHRPEARGAFAAAFLALQRQHELSSRQTLEVEPPDAGRHGRHDARRARTQYHDGAGHR